MRLTTRAYWTEVVDLVAWCQVNSLSLDVDTKQMIVDYRRRAEQHNPLLIQQTEIDTVNTFKFLGVNNSEDLFWSQNTTHHTSLTSNQ